MLYRCLAQLLFAALIFAVHVPYSFALTINEYGASAKIDSASFSRNGKFFLTRSRSDSAGKVLRLWRVSSTDDDRVAEQIATIDDPFFAISDNEKIRSLRADLKIWKYAVPTNDGTTIVIASRYNKAWVRIYFIDVATGEKSYVEEKMDRGQYSCGLQLSEDDTQGIMCIVSGLLWFDIANKDVIAETSFKGMGITHINNANEDARTDTNTMVFAPKSNRAVFLSTVVDSDRVQNRVQNDLFFFDLEDGDIEQIERWTGVTNKKKLSSIPKWIKDMAINGAGTKIIIAASHRQYLVDISNPSDVYYEGKSVILENRVEQLEEASSFPKYQSTKKSTEPVAVAFDHSGDRYVAAYDKGQTIEYLADDTGKTVEFKTRSSMNSPVVDIAAIADTKHWLLITQNGAVFVEQPAKSFIKYSTVKASADELVKAKFYAAAVDEFLASMPDDPGLWGYTALSGLNLRRAIQAGQLTITDWGTNAVARLNIVENYNGDRDVYRARVGTLFDYGVAAISAKRTALAEIALAKLNAIATGRKSKGPDGYGYQAVALLEALIISKKSTASKAYGHLLKKKIRKISGRHRDNIVIVAPHVWSELASDKAKFQYVTGLSDKDLTYVQINGSLMSMETVPRPFPDLNGNIVPPPGSAVAPASAPATTSEPHPTAPEKKKPAIKLLD